jgi:membrane associated rhomboid family serine protease
MFKWSEFKAKLKVTLILVGIVWAVFLLSLIFPAIDNYGVQPRTVHGLVGIFLCPFLHANFGHILSNTIPLAVFIIVLFVFYERVALWVILLSIILGGFMVWLMARSANHIGASGLIYALAAFLITSGLIRKNWILMIVSIILGVAYFGLIWGVVPGIAGPGISWEGHLFGAIAGVGLAFFFKPSAKSNTSVTPG